MQESVSAMFSELTLWDPSTPNTQQEAIEHPHCDDILTTAHHKHLNPTPTLQLYHHSIPTSLYHFSIHIPSILILHQLRPGTPLKIIYLWLSLSLTYRYYPLFQSQPFSPPLHSRTRSQSACVLTLILDTHITHPPNPSSSLIAIRRNIYRKQFNTSFMLTIQPLSRLMILSTSHIRHHASHIKHLAWSHPLEMFFHIISIIPSLSASPLPSISTS